MEPKKYACTYLEIDTENVLYIYICIFVVYLYYTYIQLVKEQKTKDCIQYKETRPFLRALAISRSKLSSANHLLRDKKRLRK